MNTKQTATRYQVSGTYLAYSRHRPNRTNYYSSRPRVVVLAVQLAVVLPMPCVSEDLELPRVYTEQPAHTT